MSAYSEKKTAFRESFRGYNKEDVNSYIEGVSADFGRLCEERDSYRDDAAEMSKKLDAALAEAETLRAEAQRLKEELAMSEAVISSLHQSVDGLKEENLAMSERCNSLASKSKEAESSAKEAIDARIGSAILHADEKAKSIVTDAEAEAKAIRVKALRDAELIKAEAENSINTMISRTYDIMHDVASECNKAVAAKLESAEKAASEINAKTKASLESIKVKFDII